MAIDEPFRLETVVTLFAFLGGVIAKVDDLTAPPTHGFSVPCNSPVHVENGTLDRGHSELHGAMIDRLMHHGEAILIQGESYRNKDGTEE